MKVFSKSQMFFIVIGASLVLFLLAFYYYKSESSQIIKEKHEFLQAITNIKLEQIVKWRADRIDDAKFFPTINKIIKSTAELNADKSNKDAKQYFSSTLKRFKTNGYFENVFITDVSGLILFTLDSSFNTIDPIRIEEIKSAVEKDSVIIGDFYFSNTHKTIHFNVVSIIKDNSGNPIGAYVQIVDPNISLYPIIQSWPVSSKTAETLLFRKEDDHIIYLNELRHKKNSALSLKINIKESDIVSVKAVLGSRGIIEGKDYRGIDVLADVKTVPGTDWFMVSKVDKDEIYSELFYRAGVISLIALIAILLISFAAFYIYKFQQSNIYKNLFLKEKELAETQEEYRTALYSIGDAVITTDISGNIKQMNSVAETLTGWREIEVKGKSLSGVFKVINEETNIPVENPVNRVLRDGAVVGLANHTMLISKTGNEIPIADSGSPIKNSDGKITGVVLVFRDQTEEREKEKVLIESEEKYRKMTLNSPMGMHFYKLKANNDLIFIDSNPAADKILGIDHSLLYRKTIEQAFPPLANTEVPQRYREAASKGILWATEQITYKDDKIEGAFEVKAYQTKPNNMVAVFADITQRKRAEEELKASEENYRKMVSSSPLGMHFYELKANNDLVFIDSNPAADKILGIDHTLLYGKTIEQAFPPLANTEIPQRYREAASKGILWATEQIAYKDDKIEGAFEVKAYQTKPNNMVAVFANITERKIAEENIKSSEANLNSLINNRNESIWSIDRDYNYVTFNNFFREAYFAAYNQILVKGINALNILSPELKAFWKPKYDIALSGERIKFEFSAELSSGIKYFQVFFNPILSDGAVKGVTALSVDTTEQKHAEESLKASERKLRQVIDLVPHFIFAKNIDGKFILANKAVADVYGTTAENLINKCDYDFNPNAEEVRHFIEDDKKVIESGVEILSFEETITDSKGATRYLKTTKIPFTASGINEPALLGISVDITEQKRADAVLQDIIDKNPMSIQILDLEGYTIQTNLAHTKLFSVKPPANYSMFSDAQLLKLGYQEVFENFIKGEIVYFPDTYYNVHNVDPSFPDRPIWIKAVGFPLNDIHGKPEYYVLMHENITERKLAEEALVKSEERLRLSLKAANQGLYDLNVQTGEAIVNDEYALMLGYDPKTFKETNAFWIERLHPQDKEFTSKAYLDYIDGKTSEYRVEFRQKTADNNWKWILSLAKIVEYDADGKPLRMLGTHSDITIQKNAEKDIMRLSRAVEQSPTIIMITNTDGDIEYVNYKFTEVTGYTFHEVFGKNPRLLKSGKTPQEEYKNLWETISKGNEWRGEFLNRKKNGDQYWESAFISPLLNEAGNVTSYIAVKEDISERKKTISDLIEAKAKADEMNKVKAYFFANMSHELRTPFVGIMGFSEMLTESLSNPAEKEMAEQILKSSKRLTETLNKILNVTRLEFDKVDVKISDVDVVELIKQLTTLFSKSGTIKSTVIGSTFSPDIIHVRTDGKLLEEILTNLLNNAIKYTQNGAIEIIVRNTSNEKGDQLIIKVADTGIGIPKEKQEIIWHEFRQVSEGMNRSFEGTGLGLTIIKKYVDTLGGQISLESEPGKGSTFTIELPVEKLEDREIKVLQLKASKEPIVSDALKGRKQKILYVEDDMIALSYLDKVLRSQYEIDTAFNAAIALDLANKNKYEIVLLDINLGRGIDGVELMQMMRKIDGYLQIPMVAVTAYAADSDRLDFLAKGFTHYISKPFTRNQLLTLLKDVLSN